MKEVCNKAVYNSTVDICFPTATYPDPTRQIKQFKSNLEQGFRINSINGFENVRDQKNNNFSLQYITDESLLTDIIDLSSSPIGLEVTTTTLEFFKNTPDITTLGIYIYSPTNTNSRQRSVGLIDPNLGAFKNNFSFEIEFVNDYFVRIKHNDGKNFFTLHWNEQNYVDGGPQFVFLRGSAVGDKFTERSDMFRYSVDQLNRLHLFKCFDGGLYTIQAQGSDIVMQKTTTANLFSARNNNTIYINNYYKKIPASLNYDFVSYKLNQLNTLEIDPFKSLFDRKGQYLFHCEYNSQSLSSCNLELNYFTLDTNRSEYGYIKRGTNMQDAVDSIPTFKHRKYNTLDTGGEEEGGHDKLSLIYSFYDKDIFVENDRTTAFNAPSSIYPFTQLNINDTTFTKNGAFSGPSPCIADKVYVKQNQPGHYQNGRYLCTWLSAGSPIQPGVWVDRYYYPDAVSKQDALGEIPRYIPSFDDNIDTEVVFNSSKRSNISIGKFFDKKSDLVITPSCMLKYDRIGTSTINSIIESATPIVSGFSGYNYQLSRRSINNTDIPNLGNITETFDVDGNLNELYFNGTYYTKLDVFQKINKSKDFTISFNSFIDPSKQYGFKLLGNNVEHGFAVFQDRTVTPFMHIANGKELNIYNTDGVLLNVISFDETIKDVFRYAATADFVVVCEDYSMYKVNTKGNKIRKELKNTGANIEGYINATQVVGSIYFLLPENIIKEVDVNTFNIKTLTLDNSNVFEFDAYKGTVRWYEGLITYKGNIYLLPTCAHEPVWGDEDTVFYTVKYKRKYILIKHNIKKKPIEFLRSDCIITDIEIVKDLDSLLVLIAIGNTLYEYNANGVLISETNYDDQVGGEVEGTDEEINELQSTVTPTLTSRILSLDTVNEYVTTGVNGKNTLVLFENSDNTITLNGPTGTTTAFENVSAAAFVRTPITNYRQLVRMYDATSLDFVLTLRNRYNTEDVLTRSISFDVNRIDIGNHTFTFTFDTMRGVGSLYVDGILYDDISFPAGKYKIQTIFDNELYIGAAGYTSGLDLATYLKQPGYYFINDFNIKNFFMFDKALSTSEVYAVNLKNKNIDELVLSIPHGQRNNKATIERFYKLGRHNSSNTVDIVVNNFNIDDKNVKSQIKVNLLNDLQEILPIGIKINDIKFNK